LLSTLLFFWLMFSFSFFFPSLSLCVCFVCTLGCSLLRACVFLLLVLVCFFVGVLVFSAVFFCLCSGCFTYKYVKFFSVQELSLKDDDGLVSWICCLSFLFFGGGGSRSIVSTLQMRCCGLSRPRWHDSFGCGCQSGRKETVLDLSKFVDKGVSVKLTGGREGALQNFFLLQYLSS
jgi:U6 snRNA-associated Sm-like protein LSm7